jgi:hypothetical protein
LFDGDGSETVEVAEPVLENVAEVNGAFRPTTTDACPPFAIGPRLHVTTLAPDASTAMLHGNVTPYAVAYTCVVADGRTSVNVAELAVSGPLFFTWNV